MKFFLSILASLLLISCAAKAQQHKEVAQGISLGFDNDPISTQIPNLISGPMVGYSTMQEVAIWIQVNKSGEYQLVYKDETGKEQRSKAVFINGDKENTGILIADQLKPGKKYQYHVETTDFNKIYNLGEGNFESQALWQWRTDPPSFDFALGSCNYISQAEFDRPGEPYGGEYQIFERIYEKNPNFMIWGGDNTYLREADWNSMTGIWNRYTHTRSTPEMKNLLANCHHYATWDDHEFGPNDSDRSYFLKDSTLKAFKKFWANPSYGINGKPGITTKFQWNDCEFFVMDNRYYRSPNNRKSGERHILGNGQVDWLIDNLVNSKASFKFVVIGGQLVSNAAVYENHATFAKEREQIISLIHSEGIKNVVFLSGDRHHSELSILKESGLPTIYDITSSPLTSGSHTARDEGNNYQVEGSLIHERNFAMINISGQWGQRKLKLQYFDVNGKPLFNHEILQEQ